MVCHFHQLPCQFQLFHQSLPALILISLSEVLFASKYIHVLHNQSHVQFYTSIAKLLVLVSLLIRLSLKS